MTPTDRVLRRWVTATLVVLALAACERHGSVRDPQALRQLIDSGNAAAAMVQLKVLLQESGDRPDLRFLLGRALLEGGDGAGAEIELRRALALKHPDAEVIPPLARALLVQQKARQLTREFGRTTFQDAGTTAELKALVASAYRQHGLLSEAEEATADALALRPEYAPALVMQASLKSARGDDRAAMELVDALIRKEPENLQAWILRGQLRYATGDSAQAVVAFDRALKIRPDSVSAHSALIALYIAGGDMAAAQARWKAMSDALPGNPRTRLYEAKLAFSRGDARRTREITNELLRTGSDNVELLTLAGAAELSLKAPARAQALLQKAVRLAPQFAAPRMLLAQSLLAAGQFEAVTELLQPLVKDDAAPPGAYSMLAQARLMQGDTKGADALFARAERRDASPDGAAARAILRARRDPSEANLEELARHAAASDDLAPDLALISAHLSNGRRAQALAAIDRLATKRPDAAVADELRARVFLQDRKLDAAKSEFEKALRKDSGHYPAAAGAAGIDLAQGRPEAALARFESFRSTTPGHLQATLAMAEIHARSAAGAEKATRLLGEAVAAHRDSPAAHLALVRHLMKAKQRAAAVSAAQAGVAALPDEPLLLDQLGLAQLANDETQQALSTFGRLASLTPRSAAPHLRVAEIHLARREPTQAEDAVRRALSAEPGSMPALRLAVALAVSRKQFDQALKTALEAQQRHPAHAAGFVMEAEVHVLAGDDSKAERALRVGLGKEPSGEPLRQLYTLLMRTQRSAEAERMAAAWIAAHPTDTAVLRHLGNAASGRKDWAAAERHFRGVVTRQPLDADALNNVAWLLVKQGKSGAVELAERASILSPDNPGILDTLAQAQAHAKQFPLAVRTQRRAVELAPDAGSLRLNLAKLYVAAGQEQDAREELKRLLGSQTNAAAKAEGEQLLAKLQTRP